MQTDWARVAWLVQASRALDAIEEGQLLPERKILYQFCARGHELGQSLLGLLLTDRPRRRRRLLSLATAHAGARL
jgi:2-oxoisovalerate dehydrogenase E1 component